MAAIGTLIKINGIQAIGDIKKEMQVLRNSTTTADFIE